MGGLDLWLALGGVGLYVTAAVLAVVALVRVDSRAGRWVPLVLMAGGLTLVLVLGLRGGRGEAGMAMTRFESCTVYVLILTVAYLALCARWPRLGGLGALVVPFSTVLLVFGLPALRADVAVTPTVHTAWLGVHIVSAFIAYSSFSLSGLFAVAYLVQDRALKRGRTGTRVQRLPALETLDRLISNQLGVGLVLLTFSIVLGIAMIRLEGWDEAWLRDPKVVSSLIVWCVFALLTHMRTIAHRRGRRAAFMVVLGLLCLILAFVGVHALANSVHAELLLGGRPRP